MDRTRRHGEHGSSRPPPPPPPRSDSLRWFARPPNRAGVAGFRIERCVAAAALGLIQGPDVKALTLWAAHSATTAATAHRSMVLTEAGRWKR